MSSATKYPRGSEWRKWDLHIHTPASYNYEDKSSDGYDNVISAINNSDIEAYAITDYFTLDGYEKLRDSRKLEKIILPAIELRIEDSILPSKNEETQKSDTPINLQIVFDNTEEIFPKIKEFVTSLEFPQFNKEVQHFGQQNSYPKWLWQKDISN